MPSPKQLLREGGVLPPGAFFLTHVFISMRKLCELGKDFFLFMFSKFLVK